MDALCAPHHESQELFCTAPFPDGAAAESAELCAIFSYFFKVIETDLDVRRERSAKPRAPDCVCLQRVGVHSVGIAGAPLTAP
jgi:hypothetical protein